MEEIMGPTVQEKSQSGRANSYDAADASNLTGADRRAVDATASTASSTPAQSNNMVQSTSTLSQARPENTQSQGSAGAHTPMVQQIPRPVQKEMTGHSRLPGSSIRKRSRIGEDGGYCSGSTNVTKIHEHISAVNLHIENFEKGGAKMNTATARQQLADSAKGIVNEAMNLMAKIINSQEMRLNALRAEKEWKDSITRVQEENMCLKQQIIELQARPLGNMEGEQGNRQSGSAITYMGMAMKNLGNKISDGRQLPIPQVVEGMKHAPAECIIIFKAKVKGEMQTKREQEEFRRKLRGTIGENSMHYISAIRPTRFGGNTLIFQNEVQRNKVYEILKQNEVENNIREEESCMVAPKRKVAKAVCKQPPSDLTIEAIRLDMYGRHNPAMELVPQRCRVGNVMRTRLGVMFELSSEEMQAVQMQDWRIRCDMGRELRLEEFISLQQCYACCKFGHNAAECKAGEERCRLCGLIGHTGKFCPHKDDKERWKCANCQRMNHSKNLHLDESHAAAQLHKCPVAQQQKAMRKIQFSESGVFTTPIIKGSDQLKGGGSTQGKQQQMSNGAYNRNKSGDAKTRNTRRSKSRIFRNEKEGPRQYNFPQIFSSSSITSSTSSSSSTSEKKGIFYMGRAEKTREENPCVQRTTKVIRPPSTDGWQTVGRRRGGGEGRRSDGSERGRENTEQVGVNSTSDLAMIGNQAPLTPSQHTFIDDD